MKPAKVRPSPTSRAVDEWIGKHPDSDPPPHVRMRIFDHHHGRCHITGREILPGDVWELEHIKSLRNGGENRETNLAPALVFPHKAKTAIERSDGAKADRVRQKHLGLHKPARPMLGSRASPFKQKLGKHWSQSWERRP